jgi:superfamily II DNA/RNA helicase
LKKAINKGINNGKDLDLNHCAVIYGSLPPETKKNQAYLFNNRLDGIKFLVATDAVIFNVDNQ